jgi:hypothetical protein
MGLIMLTYETVLHELILKCKQMRCPHAQLQQQLPLLQDPVGAPHLGGYLESLISAGVGVQCRGIVGCFLFKCLVRFSIDPSVQLITDEQYQHLPFPGSDEEK